MSRVFVLNRIQRLPISLEKAWDFFSNPKNLSRLTPASLNLTFTNEPFGEEMYPGQIITYKVKPLMGIPLFWMTEITHVERHKFFVDEQRRGPYALWHHQHHFRAVQGGVEMTDLVHYSIPFGILGTLAHHLLIKKELDTIFTYRFRRGEELFGNRPRTTDDRLQ